jgi:hypothetical protein
MAFKISLSPTYRTKVVVETPNVNGKVDKSEFTVEFKRVDMAEFEELRHVKQIDVLRQVTVGFSGLLDENSAEVPFNSATLEALLAIPHALFAMSEAFWASFHKAKEKN